MSFQEYPGNEQLKCANSFGEGMNIIDVHSLKPGTVGLIKTKMQI